MTKKKIDDWPPWNAKNFGKVRTPRNYAWNPCEDITAYELARALEVIATGLMKADVDAAYDRLPPEAQRHFKVVEP